jgi:polar amino acid transport system permease protein
MGMTVLVTLCALVLATTLGIVWALMRTSGIAWLAWPALAFTNVIRGIPILVQLFYIYFVLPELGIDLSAFQAGVIGLGVAYSAYMGEVFRAGILAVDQGHHRGRAIPRHGPCPHPVPRRAAAGRSASCCRPMATT